MLADLPIGCFHRIDESRSDSRPGFVDVMINGGFYVAARKRAWNDGRSLHPAQACRTLFLRPTKYASSAGPSTEDAAPSSSKFRSFWRS